MSLLKTKFFSLYQFLDKTEQRQYLQFVQSPYFNNNKTVIKFCETISAVKQYTKEALDREKIFKKVFGKTPYNDLKLRHTVSAAFKLLEEFIAIQEFRSDKNKLSLYQAKAALNHNALPYFRKIAANTALEMEKMPRKQIEDIYLRYQLLVELYNEATSKGRKPDVNLEEVIESFEMFTSINLLHLGISLNNLKNLFKTDYEIGLLKQIINYIADSSFLDKPLVKINYYGYLLQQKPDEEEYFRLFKKTLVDAEEEIHQYDIRDAYLLAINYCIRKINQNKNDYLGEILELYQIGLENKALFEGKFLPPATYQNIVTVSLRLGKHKWTNEFIENYKDSITRNHRQSFYTYAKALYLFHIGNFQETIDLLYDVKINDFFTELGSRVLVLKSFYELSEYQLLDSMIDNFRQLINRRKILSYHKTNLSNFAKYLKRLLNFNYYDHKAREKLVNQINNEEILQEKSWFLEKVDELK